MTTEQREKLLARKRRYRERHLEEERARNQRWRLANLEKLKADNLRWRLAHPRAGYEGVKRWRAARPDWAAATQHARACNRRARTAGAPGHISRADVTALWERQPVCLHCGVGRGTDHIIEFWQGGTNVPANLQNLCRACNVRKAGAVKRGTPRAQWSLVRKERLAQQRKRP